MNNNGLSALSFMYLIFWSFMGPLLVLYPNVFCMHYVIRESKKKKKKIPEALLKLFQPMNNYCQAFLKDMFDSQIGIIIVHNIFNHNARVVIAKTYKTTRRWQQKNSEYYWITIKERKKATLYWDHCCYRSLCFALLR